MDSGTGTEEFETGETAFDETWSSPAVDDESPSPVYAALDLHGAIELAGAESSTDAGEPYPSGWTDATTIPPAGLDPTGMAATNPLWVDPASMRLDLASPTMIGNPVVDSRYLQLQGTGNANCGPYSAAMVLNSITGGNGPTGAEMAQFALDNNLMRYDGKRPEWGGMSGMTGDELDRLLDAQLAPGGGSASLSTGNSLDELTRRLGDGENVIVMVDSGELREAAPDADELPGAPGNPNHFLVVTGVDPVTGVVTMNDPAKSAPSVMPLSQFLGAWADSDHQMIDVDPGTGPAPAPAETGSVVPLPPAVTSPPMPPWPGTTSDAALPPDPALSAVPQLPGWTEPQPVTPGLQGCCCVLPMTLELLACCPVPATSASSVDPVVSGGMRTP